MLFVNTAAVRRFAWFTHLSSMFLWLWDVHEWVPMTQSLELHSEVSAHHLWCSGWGTCPYKHLHNGEITFWLPTGGQRVHQCSCSYLNVLIVNARVGDSLESHSLVADFCGQLLDDFLHLLHCFGNQVMPPFHLSVPGKTPHVTGNCSLCLQWEADKSA